MSEFRRASHERINGFDMGGAYWFKRYFEDRELFDRIRSYYNGDQYRFEIPTDEFDSVRQVLADNGFALVPIEDLDPFVVAKRNYTDFPEILFKRSVAKTSEGDYTFFLMQDEATAEQAVNEGASHLSAMDADNPF